MPKPALTYLTRRGSVYWFRMAVPLDLVERVGRREIKVSLRTRPRSPWRDHDVSASAAQCCS